MSIKVKNENSSLWTTFKKSPDVLKTEWKSLGWGRRQQARVKIGPMGDLYVQSIEQGFFKRLISRIFKTLTCGFSGSLGKNVVEYRSLGHLNALKIGIDLTHKQKAFLVARQQANLGMSYSHLKEKVSMQLKELSGLQEQYSPKMLAYKELSEIIGNLSRMEESINTEVSALGEPQERFSRLCLLEAQYHFFAKAKEEKLKQWQSGLGKAIVKEIKIQKKELQRQLDELQEKISQHLIRLMQKREECNSYPELYRQLTDLIVKSTEKQAIFFNSSDQSNVETYKKDLEELFSCDFSILEEIDKKKSFHESEAEALRHMAFTGQIESGKKLLVKHIDKLKEITEKYIPNSEPEREIQKMIELHLKFLEEKPSFNESEVNGYQKWISTAILNDNKRLKEIAKLYLPSSKKDQFAPQTASEISLSPLWLIDGNTIPTLKSKEEVSRIKESVLEDFKHILITMKAHSREARQGGYQVIDKEIRLMIKEFKKKNKDIHKFFQAPQSLQSLNVKLIEINNELSTHLRRLAKIHQIISGDQILMPLKEDVLTRINQFSKRLPAEILSDEDVAKMREKINELVEMDKTTLTASEEQLAEILQRQRQLISLCYSVAEKYIKMKNDTLNADLLRLNENETQVEPKKLFLHKLRENEWKSLVQRGPACVTPHELSQWTHKVFIQGTVDEALIEELKKNNSGNTLEEVKSLVIGIGLEGEASLPLPRQWEKSLHEYGSLKRKFYDLSSERTLSLDKMKKLLDKAEKKVETWEKQNLISHQVGLKWSQVCASLQGKYTCIELLLKFDASAIEQYVNFLEEQRKHYIQTESSPLILNTSEKLIKKINYFAKWDPTVSLKALDSQSTVWNKKLQSVQKKFQLLQTIDVGEKAYAKALQEANRMIEQWNQNCQFVNQQKIRNLLDAQELFLKGFEIKNLESMIAYEKAVNLSRENLEDEIDLTKDMSPIDQLNLLPEGDSNTEILRKAIIQNLYKRIEAHLEELKFHENNLKSLWEASPKSPWHQQIFEQLEKKCQAISEFNAKLAEIPDTRDQTIEIESKIQQVIQSDLSDLENQTHLKKLVSVKNLYEPFVVEVEKNIENYRSLLQYSHAYRLNRIFQKEKEFCETLSKDLTSSQKMQAYAAAIESAMANLENVLKHMNQIGPLSDLEQMKDLISKSPEDFEKLHRHLRQEIENKIVDFHKELTEYQKRISAAIATLQCEMNMEEQQEPKTISNTEKLLAMSEKLTELEVLQAKILEKDTQLQKLREKFPVWTYAVWMGKHPLDVSQLSPDQLKEYEIEVKEFLEKSQKEVLAQLAPHTDVLEMIEAPKTP